MCLSVRPPSTCSHADLARSSPRTFGLVFTTILVPEGLRGATPEYMQPTALARLRIEGPPGESPVPTRRPPPDTHWEQRLYDVRCDPCAAPGPGEGE